MMSVEKFFALYFPLKTRSICTVKTAKWVTSISVLIFAGYQSQTFIIADVRFYYHYSYCKWVRVPNSYIKIITYIDGILYSFGPLIIMLIVNCAIIYKFLKTKWDNRYGTTQSTSQALSKSAMKGTAMLLTVSMMFLCLTAPVALSYAMTLVPDPVIYSITVLLVYSNHSINGVLYCIVGSRFRQELVNAFFCRRRTSVPIPGQLKKRDTLSALNSTVETSTGWESPSDTNIKLPED